MSRTSRGRRGLSTARSNLKLRFLFTLGQLGMKEVTDRVSLRRVNEVGKHVKTFALILDERISLAHRPQSDTCPQIVHLSKVLAPLVVDNRENDILFDLSENIRTEFELAAFVDGMGLLESSIDNVDDR